MAAPADGGLYPIALLVDEMKSDDTEVRIAAMRKVKMVAAALGPERTVSELIPFLADQVEEDDEVLLVMAEELGDFAEYVGGPAQAVCLIQLLGTLAGVEETVVRDQAVESASGVIKNLDSAAVVEHVCPVIKRLTNGDWFTSRISACGMFAPTYGRITAAEPKTELRTLFVQLCNDDTPMVRRAAALNLGKFAAAMEREYVLSVMLPLFNQLASDDQDSVRLLAIDNCVALAGVLSKAENNAHILPLVSACVSDKSWRVRFNVAKEFHPLSEAMGVDVTLATLLPAYVKLLQDAEAEVRSAAVKNAAGYCDLVGGDRFASDIVPPLTELAGDATPSVRVALSGATMDVASKIGTALLTTHLVPLVMTFLRDEACEVRLAVLEKLPNVVNAVAPELTHSTLLPALVSLGVDAQWRVRQKVIEQLPLLAKSLGPDVFHAKLLDLYLSTFNDAVCAVRACACDALVDLAAAMGAEWMVAKISPKLREIFETSATYLQRITVLYAVKALSSKAANAMVAVELLPIVLRACRDVVPNVRLVACQAIEFGCRVPVYDKGKIATEIRPVVEKLVTDEDLDVKWYAQLAVEACS